MKKLKCGKIILLYFLVFFITLWLFLPIDILTYGDLVTNNIGKYFLINASMISVLIFIFTLAVIYFNNKYWNKKPAFRIILEILFAFLTVNIIHFIAQNITGEKINIQSFILKVIRDKYFFTSCLESCFIILIIEAIYLYNKRKESEVEKEKFKYNLLINQLNPHFLFNSLNTLSAMVYTKAPDESVDYIEKLSDFYRYVLNYESKNLIPLKEGIEIVNKYGDILKTRFQDSFILNIDLKEKDYNKKILFMSLQLLVENTVKHNIASKEKPLIVNIYSENNFIVVSNNKIIRTDNVVSTGIGLDNLNERYKIVANKEIKVIDDKETFTVKIPMI